MIDADSFLEFATSSIEENGADVILRKTGIETYDTTTGELVSPTTDYPTKGLIENYREFNIKNGRVETSSYNVNDLIVKAGDRKIIIAASLDVAPEFGDKLLIGDKSFDIVNVITDFAGDTPIIYTLQIRK